VDPKDALIKPKITYLLKQNKVLGITVVSLGLLVVYLCFTLVDYLTD